MNDFKFAFKFPAREPGKWVSWLKAKFFPIRALAYYITGEPTMYICECKQFWAHCDADDCDLLVRVLEHENTHHLFNSFIEAGDDPTFWDGVDDKFDEIMNGTKIVPGDLIPT